MPERPYAPNPQSPIPATRPLPHPATARYPVNGTHV